MTQTKTKKALLMSVLSMVLCVAMLVGMTFAWFTDTASTAVNKIQAGTLDVALEMSTDGGKTWTNAEGETLNFVKAKTGEEILWEPGCTYELPKLRVVNNGNLALKYKVLITGIQGGVDTTTGKDLNEVIDWTMNLDDEEFTVGSEHSLAAKQGETVAFHEFTLKGHMQESAGNEYQGLSIDGIAITVYATQDTVENDSYGPDYDEDAPIVYPTNVTANSFEKATSVLYSKTYGGFSTGKATGAEVANHPAVIAFMKDNAITYAADLRVAIENGASVIYCKENATIPNVYSHINVLRDMTIYANGADFKGDDLSIHAGGSNYVAPENNETTINIYNAKNLVVWGEPQNVGRVWNINFYDCTNNGSNFFMYRGEADRTDTFHLTMTNCFATGYEDSTVHATADGTIAIKNCTFTNNCAPVNIAHKQSGEIDVTIENSKFINCGKINPSNDYFAPVRFVNNSNVGNVKVTLKNNNFTDTIGTNGDILLGDYRTGKASHKLTATITTEKPVMVKSSADAAYSCGSATITLD